MKVYLEPTSPSDLPDLMAMEREKGTVEFVFPYTLQEHQEVIDHPDKAHFKVLNATGQIVGFLILLELNHPSQRLLLQRIVIGPKGQGYGRATLQALKHWAFEEQQAHRLWLDVFVQNERARGLYRSEGFVEEGILREALQTKAGFQSLVVMSILKAEYEAMP